MKFFFLTSFTWSGKPWSCETYRRHSNENYKFGVSSICTGIVFLLLCSRIVSSYDSEISFWSTSTFSYSAACRSLCALLLLIWDYQYNTLLSFSLIFLHENKCFIYCCCCCWIRQSICTHCYYEIVLNPFISRTSASCPACQQVFFFLLSVGSFALLLESSRSRLWCTSLWASIKHFGTAD